MTTAPVIDRLKIRSNAIGRTQCLDSACAKFPLEIREQFRQFRRRFNPLKFPARAKHPGHLGKVIFIVGSQINLSPRSERGLSQSRKRFVDEPVFMVPFLRPGIGKINVQRGCRVRRQKILQKIRRFDLHAAQIRQPGATAFAVQLAHAAEQPLDADEIPFRMPPGVIGKE